jgi:hypothetical protein
MGLQEVGWVGVDSECSGCSGWGQVAGGFECGNEPSGSLK